MGYKDITNGTNGPIEVTLIVRKGDNPAHELDRKTVRIAPGRQEHVVYSGDDNPYLNGVIVKYDGEGGRIGGESTVAERGGAIDNFFNRSSTIKVGLSEVSLTLAH